MPLAAGQWLVYLWAGLQARRPGTLSGDGGPGRVIWPGPAWGAGGGWSGGDVACFQLRGAGHWLPGLVLGVVGSGGTAAVTYHTAVAVAIAYVAAATLAGAVTFSRRDVTA